MCKVIAQNNNVKFKKYKNMKNIIIAIIILFCASMHAQEMEVDGDLKVDGNIYIIRGWGDWMQFWNSANTSCWAFHNTEQQQDFLFRYQKADGSSIYPMRITSDGNVGIGVSEPNSKLVVDGTIKAKEVIITTALTADFVFADDYILRPLDEVEAFVNSNNHLPEVPSAKEMEDNGVGVAQMNQLLLQKVEELTLYMIAQQKQIDELKAKVQ